MEKQKFGQDGTVVATSPVYYPGAWVYVSSHHQWYLMWENKVLHIYPTQEEAESALIHILKRG